MKSLMEIHSFGAISADEDDLLDQCFEDHASYKAVKNFEKWLVVGRKGAGKTAIFKKLLTEKSYTTFAFGHTFRNYPWEHHDKQKKVGVPEHECFSHSWTYLILLTLAKILLNTDHSQPYNDFALEALSVIESFLTDTYGSRDPELSQVFQPNTKIHLKAEMGISLGLFSTKLDAEKLTIDNLPILIQELNKNIMHKVIQCLNDELQYFVAFDELDLNFNPDDENYRLRLIGLITSAREINNLAKGFGKKLNVVLFLRDDIYQFLKFEDKNKITDSSVTMIEWDTENSKHTLRDLMSKRIAIVTDNPKNIWETAFDESQKMRGHQTKYQHILDRTMLRPRDIIKFCNIILQQYQKDAATDGRDKFNNVDVNNAHQEYSPYLLLELDDEVFRHIPNHEKYYELLRDLEAVSFEIEEFEQICDKRKSLFSEPKSAHQILSDLFEFSLIGYYQPGGAGYGGAEYVFRYKSPRANFNPRAKSFQVHLGLQEALALKRYKRKSGEPTDDDSLPLFGEALPASEVKPAPA